MSICRILLALGLVMVLWLEKTMSQLGERDRPAPPGPPALPPLDLEEGPPGQPPPPPQQEPQPPRVNRFDCDERALRVAWFLGTRLYGLCMRREHYIEGSRLLFESDKSNYFAWFGLAFDRADENEDKTLSLTEFVRHAQAYYGRLFSISEEELQEAFNTYFLSKNRTSVDRVAVQQGLWNWELEQIRGREWDMINRGGQPCISPENYMRGVCTLALVNCNHAFRLHDLNGNGQISREEFRNTTETLGRNEAAQEVQWRLLDINRNGNVEPREMRMYTASTLQVL